MKLLVFVDFPPVWIIIQNVCCELFLYSFIYVSPGNILKLRPGLVAQYFDERNPAVKGLETLKAAKAKGTWGSPSGQMGG